MLMSKKVALNIHRMHGFGIFDKSFFNKNNTQHFFISYFYFYVNILKYTELKYVMSFTQNCLCLKCCSCSLRRRFSNSFMVFRRRSSSWFFSSWKFCSFCKNAIKGFIVKHHTELCTNTIRCY